MKKIFKPVLALLLLILIVSLAVGGEKLLTRGLVHVLDQAGITVGQIEFSLWRGNLDLQRIEVPGAESLPRVRINRLMVLGFNWRCLLRTDNDVLPLVAEVISVQGLELSWPNERAEPDFSCEEVYAEGWRQRLGNLAALAGQAEEQEALFEELLSYRVEVLALREPSLVWDSEQSGLLRAKAAFVGLLQPAGSVTLYPEAGRKLALFANDLRLQPHSPESFATEVFELKRLEIRDLLLPPADELAALGGGPLDPGLLLDRVYSEQPPYQSVLLDNCTFAFLDDLDNKRVMVAEQIAQTFELGQSSVLTLDILGFRDNLADLDPLYAQALASQNSNGSLDLHLRLDLVFDQQATSGMSLQAESLGLLSGKMSGLYRVQADSLGQLLTYPNFLLEALWWKSLSLDADLRGLFELWTEYLVLAENIEQDEARARISATVERNLQAADVLAGPLTQAFRQFMHEPGPIQASLVAPEPVPLPILALSLSLRPDLLDFQITVQQPD